MMQLVLKLDKQFKLINSTNGFLWTKTIAVQPISLRFPWEQTKTYINYERISDTTTIRTKLFLLNIV